MKRTRIKRRPTEKLRLSREVDLLLKEYIHIRDGWKCLKCGSEKELQSAHILSKGKQVRLRFDPLNLLTLCKGCHIFGWHKNPVEFSRWLEEKYPGRHDQLVVLAATARKPDLKELRIGWRALLEEVRTQA